MYRQCMRTYDEKVCPFLQEQTNQVLEVLVQTWSSSREIRTGIWSRV